MKTLNTSYKNWDEVGFELTEHLLPFSTVNNLARIQHEYNVDLRDICSKGQLISKAWLVNLFPWDMIERCPSVIICAGWYGMNASIISHQLTGTYDITSVDIDRTCEEIGNALNAEDFKLGKFKSVCANIHDVDYNHADLVINTSCEHIFDLSDWFAKIPKGCVVILQSNNNRFIEDHINCVDSEDELLAQCKVSYCSYKGSLELPDYKRFMVIGIK